MKMPPVHALSCPPALTFVNQSLRTKGAGEMISKKTFALTASAILASLSWGQHNDRRQRTETMTSQTSTSRIRHINPEGMLKNPAFSQVIAVTGPVRTV
jgi:hypothetical protein